MCSCGASKGKTLWIHTTEDICSTLLFPDQIHNISLLTQVDKLTLLSLTFFPTVTPDSGCPGWWQRRGCRASMPLRNKPPSQAPSSTWCCPSHSLGTRLLQPLFTHHDLMNPDPRSRSPVWHTGLRSRMQNTRQAAWGTGPAAGAQEHTVNATSKTHQGSRCTSNGACPERITRLHSPTVVMQIFNSG